MPPFVMIYDIVACDLKAKENVKQNICENWCLFNLKFPDASDLVISICLGCITPKLSFNILYNLWIILSWVPWHHKTQSMMAMTVTFIIPYLENDQEKKSVIAHFSVLFNPFILAQLGWRVDLPLIFCLSGVANVPYRQTLL